MVTIRIRRSTSVQWAAVNPILESGEEGLETDTGKRKMGDGASRWLQLDYFIPESDVRLLIQEAVDSTEGGGETPLDLAEHIDSEAPHPAYDDGPSFLLLYQNAKV